MQFCSFSRHSEDLKIEGRRYGRTKTLERLAGAPGNSPGNGETISKRSRSSATTTHRRIHAEAITRLNLPNEIQHTKNQRLQSQFSHQEGTGTILSSRDSKATGNPVKLPNFYRHLLFTGRVARQWN